MKLSLGLIILSVLLLTACERNNMTYGGVATNDNAPEYSVEYKPNHPVSTK